MFGFKVLPSLLGMLTCTVLAVAVPLEEGATCVYNCGSVCYWRSDIDEALEKGSSLHNSGNTVGSGSYPHQYNDFEGFNFPTPAPWYEFPILSNYKVYTGGSPGPDRIIFDSNGALDSLITHTGASGNNFVACKKS